MCNNCNTTPIKFSWAFKKYFCLNYFQLSSNVNSSEDLNKVLNQAKEQFISGEVNVVPPEKNNFLELKSIYVGTIDYRNLCIPDTCALIYVCGYLMKKCFEKHTCQIYIDYAAHQKQLNQLFILPFLVDKQVSKCSTLEYLKIPQDDFYNFIHKLEKIFLDKFPSFALEDYVGAKLIAYFNTINYKHPCEFFKKSFLLNLFTRFRIFTAVTCLNKSLVAEKKLKYKQLKVLTHL